MDEFSDLDLVIVVEPSAVQALMPDRQSIAVQLGTLLVAFTGEHVGEPRLLICLYGPPLLHVDLKFLSLTDAAQRVEDPAILWEREDRLSAVLRRSTAAFPAPDLQWLEDRFWVWVHYGAAKIGRGELFEAHDFLAFLRAQVLGPLALLDQGARPSGVRKLEFSAPELAKEMQSTLAQYDPLSCVVALEAAVRLYQNLRGRLAAAQLIRRDQAESAALAYLQAIKRRFS